MKMQIRINPNIPDDKFMEYCLNLHHSGFDPTFFIFIYALGKKWHTDKLFFLWEEMA
jgi:hypothetical protein